MSCSKEVPSLGSIAGFGDIYDAKTNKFTGFNALKIIFPPEYIESVKNPYTSHSYSFATRIYDKLDALNIHGSVKLSALCGIVDLTGSAKFVRNCTNVKNITQCSSIQQIKTVKERINLVTDMNLINYDGLAKLDGTHIVIGIQYGGSAVVTLQHFVNDIKNISEIHATLKDKLSGSRDKKEIINDDELNVIVEADINVEGDVTTVEKAKEFIKTFSTKLKEYNNEKGVPIAYEIIPIQTLFELSDHEIIQRHIYKELSKENESKISDLLRDAEKIEEDLAELICKINADDFIDETKKWLRNEKRNFDNSIAGFYVAVGGIKKLFHENDSNADEKLKQEHEKMEKLFKNLSAFKHSCKKLVLKSHFIKVAKENNVTYIFEETEYAKIKLENKPLHICFYSEIFYQIHFKLLKFFISSKYNVPAHRNNIIVDADILSEFIKEELNQKEMPTYPLYIYENDKYFENIPTLAIDKPFGQMQYNLYPSMPRIEERYLFREGPFVPTLVQMAIFGIKSSAIMLDSAKNSSCSEISDATATQESAENHKTVKERINLLRDKNFINYDDDLPKRNGTHIVISSTNPFINSSNGDVSSLFFEDEDGGCLTSYTAGRNTWTRDKRDSF